MVISKVKAEFNSYKLEMSFGELKGFYELTQQGTGALVDEMRANLEWYFKRLPPPGAEPDEGKKEDGEKSVDGAPKVEEPGAGEPDTKKGPVDGEAGTASISDPDSPMPEEEQVMGNSSHDVDLDAGVKDELPDPAIR